jgi:hypothetical protein
MARNRAFSESSGSGPAPSSPEQELRSIGHSLDDQESKRNATEPRGGRPVAVGLILTLIGLIAFVVWLRLEVPPF